jgi:hypothetical protein
MKAIWDWLAGKKTYGAAALLLLVGIAAWWSGAIDDVGFGVLFALTLAIAGFRDATGRYFKLVIEELRAIKAASADGKISKEEVQTIAEPAVKEAIGFALEHSVPGSPEVKK